MLPDPIESAAVGAPATVQAIDALLPQTQCTRCGFTGCRPYAEAIAEQTADIDQCPPGGAETITALAGLLGIADRPLNPAFGPPLEAFTVARVIEADCIGCFKCVLACPVDAIVGAPKFMHTVIAAQCSGCDLCLPVCPTDCIEMVPRAAALPSPAAMAADWRQRFQQRADRKARAAEAEDAHRRDHRTGLMKEHALTIDIDAAIKRSRHRRTGA